MPIIIRTDQTCEYDAYIRLTILLVHFCKSDFPRSSPADIEISFTETFLGIEFFDGSLRIRHLHRFVVRVAVGSSVDGGEEAKGGVLRTEINACRDQTLYQQRVVPHRYEGGTCGGLGYP